MCILFECYRFIVCVAHLTTRLEVGLRFVCSEPNIGLLFLCVFYENRILDICRQTYFRIHIPLPHRMYLCIFAHAQIEGDKPNCRFMGHVHKFPCSLFAHIYWFIDACEHWQTQGAPPRSYIRICFDWGEDWKWCTCFCSTCEQLNIQIINGRWNQWDELSQRESGLRAYKKRPKYTQKTRYIKFELRIFLHINGATVTYICREIGHVHAPCCAIYITSEHVSPIWGRFDPGLVDLCEIMSSHVCWFNEVHRRCERCV